MSRFLIQGSGQLHGTIDVRGSKNSALKLLSACLLTEEACRLTNVPRVEDVHRLLELLTSLGATCAWSGDHDVTVQAATVNADHLDEETVGRFRASIVLIGALLSRCGAATLALPGGDHIGARPIDAHLHALRHLGITVNETPNGIACSQGQRGDVDFTMPEFSVTATENAILASVLAEEQTTIIRCAAFDPSVQDLCWFLNSLGANITGIGTPGLTIRGVAKLRGTSGYPVMPDPVEAVTFLALAGATRSALTISGVAPGFLSMELEKLRAANVPLSIVNKRPSGNPEYRLADITVGAAHELRAIPRLHNMPYPGFVPDALPPMTVMLTQATGESLVHDWMYEGRQKYVEELNKMGAGITIADPHRIVVRGPARLTGATLTNFDIRAGASLVIAALCADGESVLSPVYHLDRGYEHLDERLRSLGAKIERQDDEPTAGASVPTTTR